MRIHIRYLYLAFALCSAACRRDQPATSDTGAGAAFRVALLTPGPVSDHSWNAGAYEGLLRIRDSLGAKVSHIQTKTPAEFDENFRQYGAQGYDLVIGHGFEFQDAEQRVAPSFPRTIFLTTSGTIAGPNYASLEFGFADASYLAGVLAGAMTKSGHLGEIGGTDLPPVHESFVAFEAGAKSVNPKVVVARSFVGNWDDAGAGKEQALAQIAQGVDVIFQNADAAGLGIFQAARESKNVLVFGSNSDQNSLAPNNTIGSVVIDLPLAFMIVARDVKAHTFHPRVVELGSESRVVKLVINDAIRSRIPAAAQAKVDSLQSLMFAGKFTVSPHQAAATR